MERGFFGFNPVVNKISKCSAWDKALYFFSNLNTAYDNVWFIEDDVFVPSVEAIVNIDDRHKDADIVSAENNINHTGELESWLWWQHVPKNVFPLPWACSMVCAVRLSKATLKAINHAISNNRANMARKRLINGVLFKCFSLMSRVRQIEYLERKKRYVQPRKFPFIEFVFHTIAIHNNLKVVAAKELSGIVWRREWSGSEMNKFYLYHPVKDKDKHKTLRLQIENQNMNPAQLEFVTPA